MLTLVSSRRVINPVVRMASDSGEAFPPGDARLPGRRGDAPKGVSFAARAEARTGKTTGEEVTWLSDIGVFQCKTPTCTVSGAFAGIA